MDFELQDLSIQPVYKPHKTRTPKPPSNSSSPTTPTGPVAFLNLNGDFEGSAWTKRCTGCKKYYLEAENTKTSCVYHPGVLKDFYASQAVSGALRQKWTCCGESGPGSGGCRRTKHTEDKVTSAILAQFENSVGTQTPYPVIGSSSEETSGYVMETTPTVPTSTFPRTGEENDLFLRGPDSTLYFKYRINPARDTLQGIALKHEMSIKDLKELNEMWKETDFYGRSFMLVPWAEEKGIPDQSEQINAEEEARKRNLIRKFAVTQKVATEEATWYLTDNDFDYELALQARSDDLAWETQQSRKVKGQ